MIPAIGEAPRCRRCRRRLSHPLSLVARLGPGCARHLADVDVATLVSRLDGVQLSLDLDDEAERTAA